MASVTSHSTSCHYDNPLLNRDDACTHTARYHDRSDCDNNEDHQFTIQAEICGTGESQSDDVSTSDSPQEDIDHSLLLPIPSPPHKYYYGFVGHLADLDPTLPVRTYWKLMDMYTPIFQMDLGMKHPRVFVGSREMVNEMADDSRFIKHTHRLHQEMRAVFGDGLFSAESTSQAWKKAHRLLVPALGPIGLSKMFDDMQDIATQLVQKWDRYGPAHEIELIGDMSRLTFDTIGLCAYGYRFNQFYSEIPHHFETELKEAIIESGRRANRPDALNRWWYHKDEIHRQENIVRIRSLCESIISERIENPKPDANDLLNIMIHGIDKETGEKLGFDNVCYQIPTLLGGGYETTSSTLSFLFYFLCDNAYTLSTAQAEVDAIIGDKVLTYDMLRNLKYLDACIKETLRMQHPVSLLTRFSTRDTVIGGRYFIKKGQMVSGIWRHFHRDKHAWGDDADVYRPERMLDEEFQKMPPNAWKPYGDGLRACIGRGFAEQEMLICFAMVLQKFDIEKVDPNYKLQLKGQMGVKPIDFFIRARRRAGLTSKVGIPGGQYAGKGTASEAPSPNHFGNGVPPAGVTLKPISVLWGGNQGTCESLVESLIHMAPRYGLEAVDVRVLDSAVHALPKDMPCIIITPSYEGRAPYNALKFVAWLDELVEQVRGGASDKSALVPAGLNFTVFGAGNSDWVHSFHRIPKLITAHLQELGGKVIFNPGYVNVKRELLGPWEEWSKELCQSLSSSDPAFRPPLDVQPAALHVIIERATTSHNMHTCSSDVLAHVANVMRLGGAAGDALEIGQVVSNFQLAAATSLGKAKRHMDILLPKGRRYATGDHLAVLGRNSEDMVNRVLTRFGLEEGDLLSIPSSDKAFLPSQATPVGQFLRFVVELALPVTRRQIAILVASAMSTTTVARSTSEDITKLTAMHSSDDVYQSLLDQRFSVIDILDEVPSVNVPFAVYLDMLLPLNVRLYSISGSSLVSTSSEDNQGRITASLTFDVFESPATSGHGTFRGVCSSHLSRLTSGSKVLCAVRRNKVALQLPNDPDTPIIMLSAGSGIAPVRALIQERIALGLHKNQTHMPLFFFGCRSQQQDYLYRTELEEWASAGAMRLIPCFSRPQGVINDDSVKGEKTPGRAHVNDKIWEMRDQLWELIQDKGAKIYICGSAARLGRSCAETWRNIFMAKTGLDLEKAFQWFEELGQRQQYVSDLY